MPDIITVNPLEGVATDNSARPSLKPTLANPTIFDLLGQLADRPIAEQVLHATFVGTRSFQYRDSVLRLFPFLRGITVVEADYAESERVRLQTAGNPLVTLVPCLPTPLPETDLLILDNAPAVNYVLLGLPSEVRRKIRLICVGSNLGAGHLLGTDFVKLAPGPESRISGPALYVNSTWRSFAINPAAPNEVRADAPPPRISVLVSTYNAEKYLRACLTDLEAQTIADQLEIIVIDSGSQQNERAIVEDFQTRYSNILYVRTEREPLYKAWNRGIQMARGKYITNANSDDAHRPDALEVLAAALDANPQAELAYADYYNSSVANDLYSSPHIMRRVVHPPYHPATLMFYCVTGCHPMWRRGIFFKIGVFETKYTAPGDYEFLLRMVRAGLRAVRVPEFLSLFYQNPKGLSYKSAAQSRYEWELIQAKYREEMPIESLFAVDPNNPESVALGWIAFGNLAMNFKAPWFDNYSQDLDLAITCYERALTRSPRQPVALNNLAVAYFIKGQVERAEPYLRGLPQPQVKEMIQNLKTGNLKIIEVQIPAAVEPLEYRPSGETAVVPAAPQAKPAKTAALPIPAPRSTVRWIAPFQSPGEFSRDSIDAALGVAPFVPAFATLDQSEAYSEPYDLELPASVKEAMRATRAKYNLMISGITIAAKAPGSFASPSDALYNIGRTTIESDVLPGNWVMVCNQMRELWVPSNLTLQAFARSGVELSKLRVVPTSVDSSAFSPDAAIPAELPGRAAWNYLFCDDWSERSGWDTLLSAYFQEFSNRDDVCLYIGSRLAGKTCAESADKIRQQAQTVATTTGSTARFEVLSFPESDLPRILQACDCVVLPARGEGWGRNQLQAMLMEKLVITTRWGAHMDFCKEENSNLIDFKLVEIRATEIDFVPLRGLKWAAPSPEHLRALLRETQLNPAAARAKGRGHRAALAAAFDREQVGRQIATRLGEIEQKLTVASCEPARPRLTADESANPGNSTRELRVAWEGSFLDYGSLSHVNRELTAAMSANKHLHITRVSRKNQSVPEDLRTLARRVRTEAPAATDVTVRHAWPPDWKMPATGAWVLIQPWEFGILPADWFKELSNVDEIWVPSDYVRRVYVDSGIDPSKVKIVPNGIDPAKFQPGLKPWPLATSKKFKFLFVGGTIHRKGPDLLLKSYLETFTAADDVCLVIKDFGGQSIYQGQTLENKIAEARRNPVAPEILYLTEEMPAEAMPRLYNACQCLVHPYRGEGFGLPVLEAMACGLPVVVTGGGATDDFASDEYAFRLPSLRTQISGKIGGMKLLRDGWWLEPDPQALAERLRWIVAHPDEASNLGKAASEHARREWTWERAARIASGRLRDLAARKKTQAAAAAPRPVQNGTPIALPAAGKIGNLIAASELFHDKQHRASWEATLAAISVRPFHPEAYLLLAQISLAAGAGDVARQCAQRACQLVPKWNQAKQFLKGNLRGTAKHDWIKMPPASGATPRLSVCMIVRDEEEFLGQCLASIREVATQIIVVDTGSVDDTVAIAEKHGAEVYHFPWCDDFGAARNAALEHATGDWILSLDADEELLSWHTGTLREAMQAAGAMAYRIPIIDKGREQEGCSHVPRLFRNAPGLFFVGRVHEQIFSSVHVRCQQWGLENLLGKVTLLHHGYAREVVSSRGKIERNLRLLQLAIEEMPNEPNLLMNYGLELVRSGQLPGGLEKYVEAWHRLCALPSSQVTPELRETLLTQLTAHLMTAKCFGEIVKLWETPAAQAGGLTATQHFSLGLAYMELKRPADGAEQMRQCVAKRSQAALTPVNKEIFKAGPNHCLGLCLAALDQKEAAARAFAAALADEPSSRRLRYDLARFQFECNQPVEALKVLNQLVAEDPKEAHVWQFGGHIALSRPELVEYARTWTNEAFKHCFANPAITLQRAEALLLNQEVEQALPLWLKAHSPKLARHLAAIVLCECVVGDCERSFSPADERLISQEFQNWYVQLIKSNANSLVYQLHESMEKVRLVLPTFAAAWERASRGNTNPGSAERAVFAQR